ncbi:MAG: hypothetical protein ACK4LQ_03810 [Pararhodobacter sp.]
MQAAGHISQTIGADGARKPLQLMRMGCHAGRKFGVQTGINAAKIRKKLLAKRMPQFGIPHLKQGPENRGVNNRFVGVICEAPGIASGRRFQLVH